MKFKDKFKPGDIICSDRFHNGLCMVVDYLNEDYFSGHDWWTKPVADIEALIDEDKELMKNLQEMEKLSENNLPE